MKTVEYNYKVPQIGDSGNVWTSGIEENFERLATHKHDGVDSELLAIDNLTRPTQVLDPALWNVNGTGSGYVQNVTIPGGLTIDKVNIRFIIKSGPLANTIIHPTIEPLSVNVYRCIVNDSALELEVLYT